MREGQWLAYLLGIAFASAGCASTTKSRPLVAVSRVAPAKQQPPLSPVRAVPPKATSGELAPDSVRKDDAGTRSSAEVAFAPPEVVVPSPAPITFPVLPTIPPDALRASGERVGGPVFAPEDIAQVPVVDEGAVVPEVPLSRVDTEKPVEKDTVETQQYIELDCPDCSGKGRVVCSSCEGRDLSMEVCTNCRGRDLSKDVCSNCRGRDLSKDVCSNCRGLDLSKDVCSNCRGRDLSKDACSNCHGRDLSKDVCSSCKGRGNSDGSKCVYCRGSGHESVCVYCRGKGHESVCVYCRGSGHESVCVYCRGRGRESACVYCRGSGHESACVYCRGSGHESKCAYCHGTGGNKACGQCQGQKVLLIALVEGPRTALDSPRVATDLSMYGQLNEKGVPKTVFVQGYIKSDGTVVRSHYRAPPGAIPTLSYDKTTRTLIGLGVRAPPSVKARPGVAESGSYYGEISTETGRPKTVHVNGYFRKDGTYVRSHYRSPPRRR